MKDLDTKPYRELFFSHWEAEKIIKIPVTDALRKKYMFHNISETQTKELKLESQRLRLDAAFREALILERLDGGCALFINYENTNYQTPPPPGCPIKSIEVLPRDRISLENLSSFMILEPTPLTIRVNCEVIHPSRCIFFQGFSPLSIKRLESVYFGESVLKPIMDDIHRAIEIRQIIFNLAKKCSVIVASVESLDNNNKQQIAELENIIKTMNNEQAVILNKSNVEIHEFSTSFGALPELITTYLKILASSLDVPVTRFLGISNSGLNQSADGDLENYYNMLQGYQESHILPKLTELFKKVQMSLWKEELKNFEVTFPPLWNLGEDEKDKSDTAKLNKAVIALNNGIMTLPEAISEINTEGVFKKKLSQKDMVVSLDEDDENT